MTNEDHTITEYVEQLSLLKNYVKEFDKEERFRKRYFAYKR